MAPVKKRKALPKGRPTKRTPETRAVILAALEQGASYESAAWYAGITDDTLRSWRRADSGFFGDCKKAREKMKVAMLAVIQRAAFSGQWQAAAWKLERIFPEEFGRRFQPMPMVVEHHTKGDAPGKVYRVAIESLNAQEQAIGR